MPQREDARIARLLAPKQRRSYYDRDTQDMLPVLIAKLHEVGGDPLKRAKEELGAMGAASAGALRRVVEENFTDQSGIPFLENALDAAALNPSEEAHDVLMSVLDHPMQAVRHRALVGLVARHARPGDFDELRGRFLTNDDFEIRRMLLRAMLRADRARTEELGLTWLRKGEHRRFWLDLCQELVETERPSTAERCGDLFADLEEPFRSLLAGPAARFGSEPALRYLRAEAQAPEVDRRVRAVRALADARAFEELGRILGEDGSPRVRLAALEGLSRPAPLGPAEEEQLQAWMAQALGDNARDVREYALKVLCERGHPGALDQALAQLHGDAGALQAALLALRDPMLADAALAERAYAQLDQRITREALRPLEDRKSGFKAMGQVPLAAAARRLRELGLEHAGESVEGKPFHEWIMIHASNTGPPGRTYLWEVLPSETDFARRLDLIGAVGSVREPVARERLLEQMEAAEDPYEALFCASEVIRIGPSSVLAPRLQRFCYGLEHVETRTALQGLLWEWY